MKSYFIVPVHNKEFMIGDVYSGIRNSLTTDATYKIIFIIDGCTDNSEAIVKSFDDTNVVILHADDLHEILCLNKGLEYIRDKLNPEKGDLIFTVQDDVILDQQQIDRTFNELFTQNFDRSFEPTSTKDIIQG